MGISPAHFLALRVFIVTTPSELRKLGTGAGDLGYPQSTQLDDGTILTVYYVTGTGENP